MIPLPDLSTYQPFSEDQIGRLIRSGVGALTISKAMPMLVARGLVAHDGRFEDNADGQPFIVLPEAEDVVFWNPRSGELASWNGRAFALGEDAISNPGTYSFDCNLNLWPDPLMWLRARCDGCVILDWRRAWSRLQDAPRIAVHERLLVTYRRHMKPPRGPETFVLTDSLAVAA